MVTKENLPCLETSNYSGIPVSRTLTFFYLPITRTKSHFPPSVEHRNFTPDFSNYPIFQNNFVSLGGSKHRDSTVVIVTSKRSLNVDGQLVLSIS